MIDVSTSSSSHQLISPTNEYETEPETGAVLIPLGSKKWPGRFALVDPQDVPLVAAYKWRPLNTCRRGDREILYAAGYASRRDRDCYMHRLILGVTDRRVKVDHENHNGLDNRRCNLRVGSHQQNIFNRRPNLHATSRYKGVSRAAHVNKWLVQITHLGKKRCVGYFDDERDAAEAYDGAALMLFGSRAYLNFPEGGE